MSTGRGNSFAAQITAISADEARKANTNTDTIAKTTDYTSDVSMKVALRDELGVFQREVDADIPQKGAIDTLRVPINYRCLGGLPGELLFKPCTPLIDWEYTPEQIAPHNEATMIKTFWDETAGIFELKPLDTMQDYLSPFPSSFRQPTDLKCTVLTFALDKPMTHDEFANRIQNNMVDLVINKAHLSKVFDTTDVHAPRLLIHKIYQESVDSNLKLAVNANLVSTHPTRHDHELQWFQPEGVGPNGWTTAVIPPYSSDQERRLRYSVTHTLNEAEFGRYVDYEVPAPVVVDTQIQNAPGKSKVPSAKTKAYPEEEAKPRSHFDSLVPSNSELNKIYEAFPASKPLGSKPPVFVADDWLFVKVLTEHQKLKVAHVMTWFVNNEFRTLRTLCENALTDGNATGVFKEYQIRHQTSNVKDFIPIPLGDGKYKYLVDRKIAEYAFNVKQHRFDRDRHVMALDGLKVRLKALTGVDMKGDYNKHNDVDAEHNKVASFVIRLRVIYEFYIKPIPIVDEVSNIKKGSGEVNIFGNPTGGNLAEDISARMKELSTAEQFKLIMSFMVKANEAS